MTLRRTGAGLAAALLMITGVVGVSGAAAADIGVAGGSAPVENHGGAPWLALPDGRGLTAGGHAGRPEVWQNDVTDVTEIYDPRGDTWSTVAPMLGGSRENHGGAVLADGRVLMAGGSTDGRPPGSTWSAIYDPATDAWHETGPLPQDAMPSVLALPDGRAMASSGAIFDPVPETWTPLAFPGGYLGRDPIVLPDGRILATNRFGAPEFKRFLYDPDTNVRTLVGGGPRHAMNTALLPDGRVMMVSFGKTRFLDPTSGQWSSGRPLFQNGAQLVALDTGRVLLRQTDGVESPSKAWSYTLGSDTWREEPGADVVKLIPLAQGRAFGGGGATGPLDAAWRYHPSAIQFADGGPSGPRDLTLGRLPGALGAEWKAPLRGGWAPITGYELEYAAWVGDEIVRDTVQLPAEARSWSTDLAAGRVATVSLRARNARGASVAIESQITTPMVDCTVVGTDGPDLLIGTDGPDVICGLGGDDVIDGGRGSDVLLGGAGVDTLRFLDATAGLTVDHERGRASGLGRDTIAEFEDLRGTRWDDTIIGGGALFARGLGGNDVLSDAHRLIGGDGDDTMTQRGLDTRASIFDGGDGVDTVGYQQYGGAVFMDLLAGEFTAEDGPIGEVREVENILGGDSLNVLYGNDGANVIDASSYGRAFGRGGNDRLTAGPFVDGGDGFDRCTANAKAARRNCER